MRVLNVVPGRFQIVPVLSVQFNSSRWIRFSTFFSFFFINTFKDYIQPCILATRCSPKFICVILNYANYNFTNNLAWAARGIKQGRARYHIGVERSTAECTRQKYIHNNTKTHHTPVLFETILQHARTGDPGWYAAICSLKIIHFKLVENHKLISLAHALGRVVMHICNT